MAEIQSTESPLARLVLFMVCLSIAGSLVAGVHYYAVDLPVQKELLAPTGTIPTGPCSDCKLKCGLVKDPYVHQICLGECECLACGGGNCSV